MTQKHRKAERNGRKNGHNLPFKRQCVTAEFETLP